MFVCCVINLFMLRLLRILKYLQWICWSLWNDLPVAWAQVKFWFYFFLDQPVSPDGPMVWPVLACPFFKSFFLRIGSLFFLILYLKLGDHRRWKVMEPNFCQKFTFAHEQICTGILLILRLKILSFVFPTNDAIWISWLSIGNPMFSKIFILELFPKMLLTSQIVGFFKV